MTNLNIKSGKYAKDSSFTRCLYCGKNVEDVKRMGRHRSRRPFCNLTHRQYYYNKLRENRTNAISPEVFIKAELAKGVNPLMQFMVSREYVPAIFKGEKYKPIYDMMIGMKQGEIKSIKVSDLIKVNPRLTVLGVLQFSGRYYKKTKVFASKRGEEIYFRKE